MNRAGMISGPVFRLKYLFKVKNWVFEEPPTFKYVYLQKVSSSHVLRGLRPDFCPRYVRDFSKSEFLEIDSFRQFKWLILDKSLTMEQMEGNGQYGQICSVRWKSE